MGKKRVPIDFAPPEGIRRFHFAEIKKTLKYAAAHSVFYKNRFSRGKSISGFGSLEDIGDIPITAKEDLRKDNWDFVAAPRSSWVDVFSTSGSTGDPVYLPCTAADMKRIAELTADSLRTAGVGKSDMMQIMLPMGKFMWIAGLAFWMGNAVNKTCSVRMGPASADAQMRVMSLLRPSVILGIPSFLIKLGEAAKARGDLRKYRPRLILITGENIISLDLKRNELGKRLIDAWGGVPVRSAFGSNEMEAVGFECREEQGHHMPAGDLFFEIVDPKTHRAMKDGEYGMLVVTHLGVKGMPLVRYAQGDITFKMSGKCRCGRTSPRIGPVIGRIDHQVKIKGVNFYPSAVENVLASFAGLQSYLIEAYTNEQSVDEVRIFVSGNGQNNKSAADYLVNPIKMRVKESLGFTPEIISTDQEYIARRSLSPDNNKPRKFVDLRNKIKVP